MECSRFVPIPKAGDGEGGTSCEQRISMCCESIGMKCDGGGAIAKPSNSHGFRQGRGGGRRNTVGMWLCYGFRRGGNVDERATRLSIGGKVEFSYNASPSS